MRVSELMSRNVASVRATDSASTAARLMWECDCGSVPVLDDAGRAVAMITDRDICMATLMQDRRPSEIAVSDAMSRTLQTCRADDDLAAAEQLMRASQIRRLPVVDDQRRPIGILSLADIVRAGERDGRGRGATATSRRPPPEEVAFVLADICAPAKSRTSSGTGAGARM